MELKWFDLMKWCDFITASRSSVIITSLRCVHFTQSTIESEIEPKRMKRQLYGPFGHWLRHYITFSSRRAHFALRLPCRLRSLHSICRYIAVKSITPFIAAQWMELIWFHRPFHSIASLNHSALAAFLFQIHGASSFRSFNWFTSISVHSLHTGYIRLIVPLIHHSLRSTLFILHYWALASLCTIILL